MNTIPLVSVICFVYNHGKYVENALKGFVMQQTNFPFEVIIHDDASTDNSPEIIKSFSLRYPKIFKPIYQSENQYSKESGRVTKIAFNATRGKYIAFCEGDDYWIDPFKLQKQVNILESDPSIAMCTHEARHKVLNRLDSLGLRRASSIFLRDIQLYGIKCFPLLLRYFIFDQKKFWLRKRTSDQHKRNKISYLKDFKDGTWYMPMCSVVARMEIIKLGTDYLYSDTGGHHAILLLAAMKGGIYHLPEIMAVKQDQENSVSKDKKRLDNIKKANRNIDTNNKINRYKNLKKIANSNQMEILDVMIATHIEQEGLVN